MQRFYVLLLFTAYCAAPVQSNSAGAPSAICKNGLVPEHGVAPQSSQVPYQFNAPSSVKAGGELPIKLSVIDGQSVGFLGFAVQAHDTSGNPVGQFIVIDADHSQTLSCGGNANTLTHRKIKRESPLKNVEFHWIAPSTKGKVKLVATVARDGGTYWVKQVVKEVNVQ